MAMKPLYRNAFLLVHVVCVFCGTPTPKGHLKPLGSHPPLHSIPVMEEFPSPKYFYEWFVKPSQPVLFKSVLKSMDYPAYRKWTDDYLRKLVGKEEALVERGKKETRNEHDSQMSTFGEFLDQYQEEDLYMVADVLQQMKEDIPILPCHTCGGFQNVFEMLLMWFSSGGTRSVLHHDSMDNINCILDGSKDLIFIDKIHNSRIEATNFVKEKGYSKVDIDKVDLLQYPHLENIPWMSAHMTKGDCLFIPQNWYHQVNSYGKRNLAINVWLTHLSWFNQTDCEQETKKSSYDSMLNQKLSGMAEYPNIRDNIKYLVQEELSDVIAAFREHFFRRLNNATQEEMQKVVDFLDSTPNTLSELKTLNMTQLLQQYFKLTQPPETMIKKEDTKEQVVTKVKDEF